MENLEQELFDCIRRERSCVGEVLRYLREVEKRQLFLEKGYSSLFSYCTGRLGYSEHEAMTRIQAMRLIRAVPEVEKSLQRGELSLSVAALTQSVVNREKMRPVEARTLLKQVGGVSKREAEKKLAALYPSIPRAERAKPISQDLVELRLMVTREEYEQIERLLDRRAHSNFKRSPGKLFAALTKEALEKLERNPT